MSRTLVVRTLVASAALLAASASFSAGPLDPPAGPIVPSYKTLTEVEPRTAINATNTPGDAASVYLITQGGSYYLTGNAAGVKGKYTIAVLAENVTIDLNGFTIIGGEGSLHGIFMPSAQRGFTVRNGTIRDHGGCGVLALGAYGGRYQDLLLIGNVEVGLAPGPASLVERVQSIENLDHGFLLTNAPSSLLVDCTAAGCATGFAVGAGEINYTRCTASANRGNGIELKAGGRATSCISAVNVGVGFVVVGSRCSLDGCNAEGNGAEGFLIGGTGSTLNRCAARANGVGETASSGFRTVPGSAAALFVDCTSMSNVTSGFELVSGNGSLDSCTAILNGGNGVAAAEIGARVVNSRFENNGARGLDLGSGSVVEACSVKSNGGDGIRINANGNAAIRTCQVTGNGVSGMIIGNGSVVEDCLVSLNANYGCWGGTFSTVRRCTFDNNGTAPGTFASLIFDSGNNLIEDNYIYLGDAGIEITSVGGGSIVRRNICNATGNNYGLIVAGNRVGPINVSATLTTTNPNDNFSY